MQARLDEGFFAQGSILQQALHDLAGCVPSISHQLQARAAGASEGAGSSDIMADQAISSASSSCPAPDGASAAKHSGKGRDQQQLQHAPADWLLAGVDAAQRACNSLLISMCITLKPLSPEPDRASPSDVIGAAVAARTPSEI